MNPDKQTWHVMLHAMMIKPVMLKTKAEEILSELNDRSTSEFSLQEIIDQINGQVKTYGQELQLQTCDITGRKYLLLINTLSNDVTETLTGAYSKEEHEVYQKVSAEIIESDPMNGVSSISLLNMAPEMTFHTSKTRLEAVVKRLVGDGWFCEKDGRVYFGVRSVAEISTYFNNTYGDNLSSCCLCKAVALTGSACDCETVAHLQCVQRMRTLMSGDFQCPKCKNPWPAIDG